jgi:hypothetical protein
MHPCCRRHLLIGTVGLAALGRASVAQSVNNHAALLAALRNFGALDPYANEGLNEIAATLATALRVPGGAAVNALPGPGGIMVCVLRAERERRTLPSGIVLQSNLAASPASDPAARVIWIDADFLRSLAMQISLSMGRSVGGAGLGFMRAVAQSMITPPPALPETWQMESSPALRHQTLLLVSRGAIGFVLAHEMAHILLGQAPVLEIAMADLPRRARQLAPMCPRLTDSTIAARRAYEERADAIAYRAVLAGGKVLGQGPAGLPGEIGMAVLWSLMVASDLVRVGTTAVRPLTLRMLERELGSETVVRLRQAPERPGTDVVGLLYTDSHPAAVQRLREVVRTLARTPGSLSYGQPEGGAMIALAQIIELECAEQLRGLGR